MQPVEGFPMACGPVHGGIFSNRPESYHDCRLSSKVFMGRHGGRGIALRRHVCRSRRQPAGDRRAAARSPPGAAGGRESPPRNDSLGFDTGTFTPSATTRSTAPEGQSVSSTRFVSAAPSAAAPAATASDAIQDRMRHSRPRRPACIDVERRFKRMEQRPKIRHLSPAGKIPPKHSHRIPMCTFQMCRPRHL